MAHSQLYYNTNVTIQRLRKIVNKPWLTVHYQQFDDDDDNDGDDDDDDVTTTIEWWLYADADDIINS